MNLKRGMMTVLLAGSAMTIMAANPFVDVAPTDWAYQSVAQLAGAGVIEGYPDSTFRGERNITRYEMAQMVARGLAHQDQADADQRAALAKLATEFQEELTSLGVRVANLEKKATVKWGGEVRLGVEKIHRDIRSDGETLNRFDNRILLRAMAPVSKDTMAVAIFKSEFQFGGEEAWQTKLPDHKTNGDVTLENVFVRHSFGKSNVTVGRIPVTLGVTGMFYSSQFDGMIFQVGNPKGSRLSIGYGHVADLEMEFVHSMLDHYDIHKDPNTRFAPENYFIDYTYEKERKITAKAFFMQPSSKTGDLVQVIGAGLSVWPHPFVNIHGDYFLNNKKNVVNQEKPLFWTAGISFGIAHPLYAKSFQVGIDYVHTEAGSYFGGSKFDVLKPYLSPMKVMDAHMIPSNTPASMAPAVAAGYQAKVAPAHPSGRVPSYFYDMIRDTDIQKKEQKYTFTHGGTEAWMASLKYVPMKRLLLEAYYVFNAKSLSGEKMDDGYRVQATYYF